jgi:DNA-binding response OmpR family regulator
LARVVALAPDLFFGSKIKETLTSAGHDVEICGDVPEVEQLAGESDLVIVDLHAEGLDPAQLSARLGGTRLLGFYSHIDVDTRAQAERAGFHLVVPRSRMARDMPELVARLVKG